MFFIGRVNICCCFVLIIFIGNLNIFSAKCIDCERSNNADQSVGYYDNKTHCACERPNSTEYFRQRKLLIDAELNATYGSDIILNSQEELANKIIMNAKELEYRGTLEHPAQFIPSRHIFERLNETKNSKLFQILRKMPKGGILHTHDTAMVSAEYLVNITYMDNLWQLTDKNKTEIKQFRFSLSQPTTNTVNETWQLVKNVRNSSTPQKYDALVRSSFTFFDKNVNPLIQFNDVNEIWARFWTMIQLVNSLVAYAPVWKAYYKQAMKEMLEDGVQYFESRGFLSQVTITNIVPIAFNILI